MGTSLRELEYITGVLKSKLSYYSFNNYVVLILKSEKTLLNIWQSYSLWLWDFDCHMFSRVAITSTCQQHPKTIWPSFKQKHASNKNQLNIIALIVLIAGNLATAQIPPVKVHPQENPISFNGLAM